MSPVILLSFVLPFIIVAGCGNTLYGNSSVCQIGSPESMNIVDGFIYIGAQDANPTLPNKAIAIIASLEYSECTKIIIFLQFANLKLSGACRKPQKTRTSWG